jgi:hypothetical protein
MVQSDHYVIYYWLLAGFKLKKHQNQNIEILDQIKVENLFQIFELDYLKLKNL